MASTDPSPTPSSAFGLREPHFNVSLGLEWTIHECPRTLWSTFKQIFPDLSSILPKRSDTAQNAAQTNIQVIATWQPTLQDMSGFSDKVQEERDAKTGKFIDWAKQLCPKIKEKLACKFVDFVDPSSGLPFLGNRGSTIFIETDDAIISLGYQIRDFGCCKAVDHSQWGTKSFMAIILTDASPEGLFELLQREETIHSE